MLAASLMVPSALSAKPFHSGANDTIRFGLIGCNSMGFANLENFLSVGNCVCVALSDIDQQVLDRRAADVEALQKKKPDIYKDYRKLLERKDIDVVIIGTPDHWHCLQFVDACAAEKDVYVEKPIANSIAECEAMVAAAARYNRVVQVGQQQRSGTLWKEMKTYLDSGKLGNIGRVHVWANFNYAVLPPPVPDTAIPPGVDYEMWLGPAPLRDFNPQRFHGSWRMFWDYGGGLVTDWGVHLLDMGLWGMNVNTLPETVSAAGGNFYYLEGAQETLDTLSVNYRFRNFIMTWENNAGVESGPYGKNYGLLFKGTNGTLVANREGWQVYPEGNKIEERSVSPDHQDGKNHAADFLQCVRNRNKETACTIENGSLCASMAQLGNISARLGGVALHYDTKNKIFGDASADNFLKPLYRSPWRFPE